MAISGESKVRLAFPLFGKAQDKQKEFFRAREKYVAFGGARGGGKSWAVREKAKRLAVRWAGIRILILRKTLTDLRENHILPLRASVPARVAVWRESEKSFLFANGSRIKCSYFACDADALSYQGQEYDVIFLEEATQFTEQVFHGLKACLRGANPFPKRMYLTCNPDGIGFAWVKRLFVSRDFRPGEKPEEYRFIKSLVDDNPALLKYDAEYVAQLDSLPDGMRERWRYGCWDAADGQYFSEFRRDRHVCEPFSVPSEWARYVCLDYGLDMLAVYWVAVDSLGGCWVYREYCKSDLPISAAAEAILSRTGAGERIREVLAPPDLWGRSQETGRSRALIFEEAGLSLTRSSNDREAGWLAVKELLRPGANGEAKLHIFSTCTRLVNDLPALLCDPANPSDCRTEPHEVTHSPDALRYFAVWHTSPPRREPVRVEYRRDWLEDLENARGEEREYIMRIATRR